MRIDLRPKHLDLQVVILQLLLILFLDQELNLGGHGLEGL